MCQTRKSVLQLNIQTLDDALLHFDGLLLEICLIDANKKLIFCRLNTEVAGLNSRI